MGSKGRWNPPEDTKPSFKGRNVIVTGANSGLGFEASLKFVQLSADRVILAVRSIKKGEAAKAMIETTTGRKDCIEVWQLDMMSYDSIRAFAVRASKDLDHLDIAILNAGIQPSQLERSKYGWETCLQCNTLSTMLLSLFLLPKLKSSKTDSFSPVLELVSSSNHYMITKVDSDPTGNQTLLEYNNNFTSFQAYGISKLFLMYGLAGLVEQEGVGKDGQPHVFITSVCPGGTKSNIMRVTLGTRNPSSGSLTTLSINPRNRVLGRISAARQLAKKAMEGFGVTILLKSTASTYVEGRARYEAAKTGMAEIVNALKKDVPEVHSLVRS